MTHVVAALIWERGRFLACQRPANKTRGLLWEFVGGKVEPGETKEEALLRECREELGVDIAIRNIYFEVDHIYPDISIHLTLFNATILHGTPQTLEHNDIQWIYPSDIPQYSFCPADELILKSIIEDAQKMDALEAELFRIADPKYKAFHSSLMPTVASERVIGVRMPALRKLAKCLAKDSDWFIRCMCTRYYEEQNLYGILISECKDFDRTVSLLNAFLPEIDNWATCDLIVPCAFKNEPERTCNQALIWLTDQHAYTIRFAIGMLMRFGLDLPESHEYSIKISQINSDEYYVKMMIAWYFATALSKNFDKTIVFLESGILPKWIHNKTIQKAIESFRITNTQKEYIRTLRK